MFYIRTNRNKNVSEGTIGELLHPLETALTHLPKYMINDKIAEKVINGAVLPIPEALQERKGFHCY